MKKILSLLCALCFVGSLLAQQEKPDAVIKQLHYTYTVNDDGTSSYQCRRVVRLLRLNALSAFGETFIVYNPAIEKVKINECYTLRPDGTRIDPPTNAIINQLPHACANCGRLNGMREVVIVHTALELNAEIVMDYTITRQHGVLDEKIQVEQACPIKDFDIVADLPRSQKLDVKYSQPLEGYGANAKEIHDHHTYHLHAENVPTTLSYPDLPNAHHLYTIVTLSNNQKPELRFNYEKIEGVHGLLHELQNDDNEAYVTAIRNYVVDNIRLNDVKPAQLGFRLASANEVWQSGCGTLEEKALLAASLMRQAGFDAYVAEGNPLSFHGSEVDVAVEVTVNNMIYHYGMRDKSAPRINNVAKEEVLTIEVDSTFSTLDTVLIADNYYTVNLPFPTDGYNVQTVAALTPSRNAPVKAAVCDMKYHYSIPLPKEAEMLGDKIKIQYKKDGVGSIELVIKQKRHTLDITRNLKIEKRDILPADYEAFRQLMIDWNSYRTVTIKMEK